MRPIQKYYEKQMAKIEKKGPKTKLKVLKETLELLENSRGYCIDKGDLYDELTEYINTVTNIITELEGRSS